MRAVTYHTYGSPDVLRLADIPRPTVRDGDILVRVHAVALNALDWHMLRGKPYIARLSAGLRRPKRHILGVDVAGTVEAIGKDVTLFKPGDEVFANKGRACAEYVCGPESLFAHKPANLTLEQAAAIPAAGITALQALRDKGNVQPGEKVLINGAAGGVGTFAVQIARAFGAEVTGVCSTQNVEMVRSIGAQDVIDYTRDDFTRIGKRFDLIIDVAASRSLRSMRRVLAPNGRMVLVGASKGEWIGPMVRILGASQLSRFSDQKMVGMLAEPTREDLLTLTELVETGKVTPVIDRTYSLSETADAIRYLETMHARAKIIITI